MIGLAIRLALALGLHLRNEDVGVGESNKESRVLTWWSLNSIECLMSTTTGRPPAVAYEDCTVPLPYTLLETRESNLRRRTERGSMSFTQGRDTSNESQETKSTGQHHLDHINITIIMQKVLIDLYSPRTAAKSWEVCLMLHFLYVRITLHLVLSAKAKVDCHVLTLTIVFHSSSKERSRNTSKALRLGRGSH
jgi:hypothetical protein